MKHSVNKENFLKLYQWSVLKFKMLYYFLRPCYLKLLISALGTTFVVIVISMTIVHSKKNAVDAAYPVKFEINKPIKIHRTLQPNINTDNARHIAQLQKQLADVEANSAQYYQTINVKLQQLQSTMTSLASQHEVKQLQQQFNQPNQALLGKVNSLQGWVQEILQQTAVKRWIDPSVVGQYFHLEAVQGFSDGMRAIIDIDGNQTALSVNEICPACRGWRLKSMDFSNQSAVFYKNHNNTLFLVKLQANS